MKKSVLILILLSFSCTKKDLSENFRKSVIEYQNKFPIPDKTSIHKNITRPRIYIYHASFYKEKKDTMFLLSRIGSGINKERFKGYGVYEDSDLKPLVIIDNNNLSGNFIYNKKREIPEKYIWKTEGFPENCTPLYRYKVKNKEFKLVAIDTIWLHWE
jgi:hypothetical protein